MITGNDLPGNGIEEAGTVQCKAGSLLTMLEKAVSPVGSLLSEYRKRHHLSQLELALQAEVSSRHISFIETGKTRPSRTMLLRLADTLGLSLYDSNLLLNAGGYTAAFTSFPFASDEMAPVRDALRLILQQQNPYPALVLDSNWNILMVNEGQQYLASRLGVTPSPGSDNNLLTLVFDPDGFRPLIANWAEVAAHLLRRLRRQVLAYGRPGHLNLLSRLLELDPPDDWQVPGQANAVSPVLTVDLGLDDGVISLFSTLSQFGTALDVGTEEILIESYFPANDRCRRWFRDFHP